MNCTNCGATATPACLRRGVCTFCGAAIQRADVVQPAPPPSLEHGVAEILRALGQGQALDAQTVVSSSIVADGRTYGSVDELPPHLRAIFEQATQKTGLLGAMGSNVSIQRVTAKMPPLVTFELPAEPARRTGSLGVIIVFAALIVLVVAMVVGGAIFLAR